jgi:hypothetical protein
MKGKFSSANYGYIKVVLVMQLFLFVPHFILSTRATTSGAVMLIGTMIYFLFIGGLTIRQYGIEGKVLICKYMFGVFTFRKDLKQYYKFTTKVHNSHAPGIRLVADTASYFSKTNMHRYRTIKLHSLDKKSIRIEARYFANECEYNKLVAKLKVIVKNNGNIKL